MDAPLGVTFFKKVELYQKIVSLDRQTAEMERRGGEKPLWPLEKRVLIWSRTGHKHLGSPIKTAFFSAGSTENKLKDFRITKEEMEDINLTRLLDNLIAHGFASEIFEGRLYTGQVPDENKVYLTKDGLLVGEILNECKNPLLEKSYQAWSYLWGHFGGWILLFFLATIALHTMAEFVMWGTSRITKSISPFP